jgi:hypothetical protein
VRSFRTDFVEAACNICGLRVVLSLLVERL